LALVIALFAASAVQAQAPAPATVADMIFAGTEDCYKVGGKLGFLFKANGKAFMVDETTRDPSYILGGTWTQTGNQVEIRFGNCVYRGQLNGTALTGTDEFTKPGQFAAGNQRSWPFRLQGVSAPVQR